MKNKLFIFIFISMLLFQMISAVLISDQGTDVKNKSSGSLLSLGNLSISIYDSATAGTLIFQSNTSNTIINGSWNLMISPTLEFGKNYWKDYAIDGQDLDFDGNERIEFQSPLGPINNASFINFSLINSCSEGSSIRLIYANGSVECETDDSGSSASNLTDYALKNQSETFAGNITTTQTGFFGWLGNLASRITKLFVQDIDASGDINVTGNVTASYFIGDGSKLTGINTSGTDSWSTNYTDYYNGTIVNQIVSGNSSSSYDGNASSICSGSEVLLGNGTCWGTEALTDTYNSTYANNLDTNESAYIQANEASWLSTYNATYADNINTDSWSGNYTNYYNKTRIDENFTNFMSIISWNTNITNIFSQINLNYTSSLETCNSNINNNLTAAEIYANSIVVSNDTWRTNYSSYLTGSNTNTAIIGNLSLALLANGSRALSGDLNLAGFNITNVGNITAGYICNSTNCYTLAQFLVDTTGENTDSWALNYTDYYNKTRIDENFSLYMLIGSWNTNITNIFAQINNNLTAAGLYANSIVVSNDTWRTNYTLYPTKEDLYANLTNYLLANGSRALTGDLNLAGYNITNVGNITAGYICNSTNCYTLAQFLTQSESTDSWSGNYTNYYNKTRIDENFTNFMSIISWNTNITNIFSQINLNYTSSLETCNANINNNLTSINTNINNNLTAAEIYTNTNIVGNLSLALLANGSRAMTGDLDMGGKNITNVANITIGNAVMYWDGTKLVISVT